MTTIDSAPEFVASAYKKMESNLDIVGERLNRPLSSSEKVLLSHLDDPAKADLIPGESYIQLRPDRVAHQDVTGQMAILQFMQAGRDRVAVPTSVHCDHLIQARVGSNSDTTDALEENHEVYQFLRSSSARYGMDFWKPGAGIIHQVVLENYAFPGGLMIGTDSHTPNAGGLGMLAIGVGGADGADVMAGLPWELLYPKRIGVYLTGALQGWTSPKDVILYLAGILTVSGGTNSIIEYLGPGALTLRATGKATICNMGAELGATGSIFPFDPSMARYLTGTRRDDLAALASSMNIMLRADPEVESNPEDFFDRVVHINLSTLEPHIVGPHTPDLARPISKMADDVKENGYLDEISVALIGSCTNSSYEDMSRAADVAQQATDHGNRATSSILVSPGSEQIRATIQRDGQTETLENIGATVLANACGPCIGQWRRSELKDGEPSTIVSSFNRNFPQRNDGRPTTMNFIASPEIVVALGLAGRLSFNPLTDTLTADDGTTYKLEPPRRGPDVPPDGFDPGDEVYVAPPDDGTSVTVVVNPDSQRLQILQPFEPWDGKDFVEVPVLLKAKGKCTTDHISPAGPWLRFRGHLDNLSNNMFLGAVNAFTDEVGKGLNPLSGKPGQEFTKIARELKTKRQNWVAVGDFNYGEGSSREHAALSPKLLGAVAVITRSFARIHETNLKKQGLLALTFTDSNDYEKVLEGDRVTLHGLKKLAPDTPVKCTLHHSDGTSESVTLSHTLNKAQIEWFKAGTALNLIRKST
ncbi:aconitate hydratase [SAR202 cluster bacterium AD-804-J14_MRT_500m]|nr:aconitate hydratase [SAR202 cluster bacterium AD-804-J14_MRT_500m]